MTHLKITPSRLRILKHVANPKPQSPTPFADLTQKLILAVPCLQVVRQSLDFDALGIKPRKEVADGLTRK
jgi:hypothetical protein